MMMQEREKKEESSYNHFMKKIAPYLIIILFIALIIGIFLSLAKVQHMVVIKEGNLQRVPLPIELKKYQDSDCGMVIEDMTYVSEVIAPDGKTWFFHDHGGMVNWLKSKSFKDDAIIWSMTKNTKRWMDAKKLWYSRTDITPMEYGFGAYEKKQNNFINFNTMFLYMARGEHLGNPYIKKQLLEQMKDY